LPSLFSTLHAESLGRWPTGCCSRCGCGCCKRVGPIGPRAMLIAMRWWWSRCGLSS